MKALIYSKVVDQQGRLHSVRSQGVVTPPIFHNLLEFLYCLLSFRQIAKTLCFLLE